MRPYYEEDGVVIYHADCREVLLSVAGDVLITDPPYGIGLGPSVADPRTNYLHKDRYASYEDTVENLESVVIPGVRQALEVTQRGIVFFAGCHVCKYPAPSAIGAIYLPSACGRTLWGFNNLSLYLLYGQAPSLQKGCKHTSRRSTEHTKTNGHPCPKPIGWMRWLVDLGSRPGETVIDPFMGSGTTLRAAKDLGRKAIGIEIEERYCEIAAKRLAQKVLPFPEG